MEPLPFERVFHTCNEAYKAHRMAMASPHSRILARLLLTANETSDCICPPENHLGAIHLHNKSNETSICQNVKHNEFFGKRNDAYMCSLVAPKEWCEFIGKVKIKKLQLAWPPTMTQWRVANTLASRLLFFLECHFWWIRWWWHPGLNS
jgi:hypothetical protein